MSIKDRSKAAKKIWGKRSIKDMVEAKKKLADQQIQEEKQQQEREIAQSIKGAMSIKGRVEAKKKLLDQQKQELEKEKERRRAQAKKTFAPVYEAFLEIEKEYGKGDDSAQWSFFESNPPPLKGYKIEVSDSRCRLIKLKQMESELATVHVAAAEKEFDVWCDLEYPDSISVGKVFEEDRYTDPAVVINLAIDWIAKYIEK